MLAPVRWTRRTLIACLAALLLTTLLGTAPASAAPTAPAAPSSEIPAGVSDSVVRLYQATFDRTPDAQGFLYWVDLYRRGLPLTTLAEHFMTSSEWRATVGSPDDATFVDLLYRNVLGRPADPDGAAYWQGELSRGYPRAALVVSFSESPELVAATGTAPPVAPAPWPKAPANSGSGKRIVYGNSAHRVWMVDSHDLVVDTYLVSGKAGVPAPGSYSVYSKSENAWAGHDGITMKWMVRFAHGSRLAIGFHSIPRDAYGRPLQTEAQLGTYRSSGCVRQADHKAQALYAWAPIGTRVVVLR